LKMAAANLTIDNFFSGFALKRRKPAPVDSDGSGCSVNVVARSS
jgi:hypothetical protein